MPSLRKEEFKGEGRISCWVAGCLRQGGETGQLLERKASQAASHRPSTVGKQKHQVDLSKRVAASRILALLDQFLKGDHLDWEGKGEGICIKLNVPSVGVEE